MRTKTYNMKVNELFLKAKKDKALSSFLVIDRVEDKTRKKFMRLCLDLKNPYTKANETTFVETETSVKTHDYEHKLVNSNNYAICFHMSNCYTYVQSFLDTITKKSEVSFLVQVKANSQYHTDAGFVCHQLIGTIDKKDFLLWSYVGPDNLASPIQF